MTLERLHRVLQMVMGWEGAKATYMHDFGDGWEHLIVVEKLLHAETGMKYPVCVAGKLRGPPEDCGGVVVENDGDFAVGDVTRAS